VSRWARLLLLVLLGTARVAGAEPDGGSDGSAGGARSTSPGVASSSVPSASAAPVGAAPGDAGLPPVAGTCVEHVPPGKSRPKLQEKFPARGLGGYAEMLEITVEHGKGETVLPEGFRAGVGGDENRRLHQAGFALPELGGGSGYELTRSEQGDRATTTVKVPFLVLPTRSGRQDFVLPPVPVAIARASGEVLTLCTEPHPITIDEPIANLPNPVPQSNPPARRQLEEWTLLKHLTWASLVALVVGALLAWLIGKWLRRPRRGPPPPPPRPPWEVALEGLHDLRHAGLIEQGRLAEHFDRSSHTVRKYLGDRYGFDGLESTTREMLYLLRRVSPAVPPLVEIEAFLRQADLVKFARLTPTGEECRIALDRGEEIVRRTVPAPPTLEAPEGHASFPPQADSGPAAYAPEPESPKSLPPAPPLPTDPSRPPDGKPSGGEP
jgi:hypothetical protein